MINIKHGPCERLLLELPDKSFDMICADMPYGTTRCKWDSLIDLNFLWPQLERVIKDNGVIILFAQTPFDKVLGSSNLKLLRYEWIWEKPRATGHLNANKMPMKAHENILVFYKKLPTYNAQKTTGHKPVNSFYKKEDSDGACYGKTTTSSGGGSVERYPRSVQVFSSDTQKLKLHETQKPIALYRFLTKTYTNVGDNILDFCMGSGGQGVAAKELRRNFTGFEKYADIFKTAETRILNTLI